MRALLLVLLSLVSALAADPFYRVVDIASSNIKQHSRDPDWKPGQKLALEVTGIVPLSDNRLAVTIRKGEIWTLHDVYAENPSKITYTRFASGLDEPLGLLADGQDLLTVQRSELTRLRDTNRDNIADEYLTVASGWNVSGAYHGYAYGPARDRDGNFWVTLNLDLGKLSDNDKPWRGWALRISPDGNTITPMAAGLRSPCGLGSNAAGDIFATDQQGNWIPTNTLLHLREGAFFGNPDGMAPASSPGSPVAPLTDGVDYAGKPFPEALTFLPQLRAPAVWFPYNKIGQSRTGLILDDTGGKFGPFKGQFFVGEFTQSKIGRVFLEKIDGEYQGACFPFFEGFPAAVMSLAFGRDGSLFVGMTNRGWSSVGGGSYGLQRLVWSGNLPFEAAEMRAKPEGFELVFTKPVDPVTASDPNSYSIRSYTYRLHQNYGSDEILTQAVPIVAATVSEDRRTVLLTCSELRPFYVHELHYSGVCDENGGPPRHDRAYYTLNRIPRR